MTVVTVSEGNGRVAHPSVFQRVVNIIDELPAIDKSQRNEQQGFMFRGHDDILNALNPLLAKHGVVIVPNVLERATAQRTTRNGGVMFEVSLHVQFTFYGANGDSFSGSTWGEGTDSGDKATSKALTMAFKSMLNQAFAVSNKETVDPDRETAEASTPGTGATKDSGATRPDLGSAAGSGAAAAGASTAAPQHPAPGAASVKQQGFIKKLLGDNGFTVEDLAKPLDQFTKVDASQAIEQLQAGTFNPASLAALGAGFIDDDSIPFAPSIDGLGN